MNKKRYDVLQEIINLNKWDINPETGIIKGVYGREIGSVDENGYKRVHYTLDNKIHKFGTHEVILVNEGYDIVDKEVMFEDGDRSNASIHNLRVVPRGFSAKRKLINIGGVKNIKINKDKIDEVTSYLNQGHSIEYVEKECNVKRRTIKRIQKRIEDEKGDQLCL